MLTHLIRVCINLVDWCWFRLWLLRFHGGYKLWGIDFQQRQISRAPLRYLAKTLRGCGADIAATAVIKTGLFIDNLEQGLSRLKIGNNAYVGPAVFLDIAAPISIEAEVVLAPRVMILTHGDVGNRILARFIKRKEGPVNLKRGCWIGAGAVILSGITVGEGAIVGAGAVVTMMYPVIQW